MIFSIIDNDRVFINYITKDWIFGYMNLCRCEKGHFYDKEKYEYCPHCYLPDYSFETIDPIIKEYSPVDGEWEFLELIGVGTFGRVYKIFSKADGIERYSALKVISIDEKNFKDGSNCEIDLMYKLNDCENVVKVYKHFIYNRRQENIWDILILMELLTPIDVYFKNRLFAESDILNLALDICSALKFCEKFNIIHQDIKTENIFVNADGRYKLGDFGSAFILNEPEKRKGRQYTLHYCAPEVYFGQNACFGSDIYSLGITLYKLLNYNRFPFLPKPPCIITKDILKAAHNKRMGGAVFQAPDFASKFFSNIILKACAYDIEDRYKDASELLRDLKEIENVNDNAIILYTDPIEDLLESKGYGKETNPFLDTTDFNINPSFNFDDMNLDRNTDSCFDTKDFNIQTEPDFKKVEAFYPSSMLSEETSGDVAYVRDTENFNKRIINRMINWIGFTCMIALIPLFIYILFKYLFSVNISLDNKIITDLFYFGLTLSVVTIREMVSLQLWKKEKNIYLLALFIILIILILSAVFFGAMTMNEMQLLKAEIHNKDLLVAAVILSISSFFTGSFIQIWEET